MSNFQDLLRIVPQAPDFGINWQIIQSGIMRSYSGAIKKTQQNPKYHAEGNVWNHTKMVCESIVSDIDFWQLPERQRQEVFIAALFHDVGKIVTTKIENGEWTSPNHSIAGTNMIREILWRDYGICGTKDLQNFRETVCFLIRYHMTAPYIIESDNPEQRLIKIAANGELAPDFTLKLLFILAKADANGRISDNNKKSEETVILDAELAKDIGCYEKPLAFASKYTEFSYLSGKKITPETELYNDKTCEVIMLCGLPGTGKDTWIKTVYPDYPMISLDDIRKEYNISPVGNQQEVIRIAKARAKELLREKQSFVWNATSITPNIRSTLTALFKSYNAYFKIVFLETGYNENLCRNKKRKTSVPNSVIDKMLAKLTPPERFEAHEVDWICNQSRKDLTF